MQSFTLQSFIIQVIIQQHNYESNYEELCRKNKDTSDVQLFTTNIAK